MRVSCPLGHEENLSYEELAERLDNREFGCKAEGCSKDCSFEIDERFFEKHLEVYPEGTTKLHDRNHWEL